MKRKITVAAVVVLVLLIDLPVLVTQFWPREARQFQGVHLAEMQFEEIAFQNDEQNIRLGGMLYIPDGEGPFPAAIMIHGSGTSHRDNGWYLTLTQYLQDNGIVVLLPDKRGSEHSEGDWRTASYEDLATDTLAAIEFLRTQELVPVSHIGLIGMSQGGHIAPLVASQSDDLSYVINVVGAAVAAHDQLLYEENHNLRQIGFLPGISNLLAYGSTAYLRQVRDRDFWTAVGNFDPLPYWATTDIPALVLYGSEDTNVPSERSAERLHSLNNPHIEVVLYEDSGHALEDPLGVGNSVFREDALRQIAVFVLDSTKP